MSHTLPDRSFFERSALEVAPLLLGATLTSRVGGAEVAVRITETEAYLGLGTGDVHDEGSHARMGPTARNRSMFGPPGHLYVYFIYGMYDNVNVVCSPDGQASGVLLRAGEIVSGHDTAWARRPTAKTASDLARGPARLAMALGFERAVHDGIDLLNPHGQAVLRLDASAPPRDTIRTGPRVGVSGEAGTEKFPWRFWLDGEPTVSPYRAAKVRGAGTRPRSS